VTTSEETVGDLAVLVRAKNAGPFWLTLDIFCANTGDYDRLAAPSVITAERMAQLYGTDPTGVRIFRMPDLLALKISFPRPTVQGGVRDRDMHAGQQHVPLARLRVIP
jgi:hypothetical protein